MRSGVHLAFVSALVACANGCLPHVVFDRDGAPADVHANDVAADAQMDAGPDGPQFDAIPIEDIPTLEVSADAPVCEGGPCAATARLIAPLSGSVIAGQVSLRYELSAGADMARITVCPTRDMTAPGCMMFDTNMNPRPTPLAPGAWFWSVRALTGGVPGDAPSNVWEFFIPTHRSTTRSDIIATVPDINGDGLGDAIIGSDHPNAIGVVRGQRGTIGTTAESVPVMTGQMAIAHAWLSHCDVDGDGYVDIVVGAPMANSQAGAVSVALGGPDLPSTSTVLPLSASAGDHLGFVVTCIGDVDEDGYGDVAIGAPDANAHNGRAVVVFGPLPSSMRGFPIEAPTTPSPGQFGYSLAGGDVDGDGHVDLVIGEPYFQSNQGRAFVSTGTGTTLNTPTATLNGATNQYIGITAATVGDVNADGRLDYAVGGVPVASMSIVHVYRSLTTEIPIIGAPGFGTSVTGIDLNRDGNWDAVIGSPLETSSQGAIRSFTAPGLGDTGSPQSPAGGVSVGASVANAGDMDGDGNDELVVGAPGSDTGNGYVFIYQMTAIPPTTYAARVPQFGMAARHFGTAISR